MGMDATFFSFQIFLPDFFQIFLVDFFLDFRSCCAIAPSAGTVKDQGTVIAKEEGGAFTPAI